MRVNAILIASVATVAYARPIYSSADKVVTHIGIPESSMHALDSDTPPQLPKRVDIYSLLNPNGLKSLGKGIKTRQDLSDDVDPVEGASEALEERQDTKAFDELTGQVAKELSVKRAGGLGSLLNLSSLTDVKVRREALASLTALTSDLDDLKEKRDGGLSSLLNLTNLLGRGLEERERVGGLANVFNLSHLLGGLKEKRETESGLRAPTDLTNVLNDLEERQLNKLVAGLKNVTAGLPVGKKLLAGIEKREEDDIKEELESLAPTLPVNARDTSKNDLDTPGAGGVHNIDNTAENEVPTPGAPDAPASIECVKNEQGQCDSTSAPDSDEMELVKALEDANAP